MKAIPPDKESDYFFVADSENNVLYTSKEDSNITDFPFIYRDYFFKDWEEGILYEKFGVDEQLYSLKVSDQNGDSWYIGYKYNITDGPLLIYYFSLITILILIFGIILYIWARNHSINLKRVSDNLKEILESEHIDKNSIVPIVSNDEIGDLSFYYNKIQKKLIDQQDIIKQQGQLVSLGQMIGGIAHNLKTPILSIAGAAEGIKQLAEEMEESLVTPTVTLDDKKEIIQEQEEWVEKIKVHLEYMNDVITAVKGQATTFTTEREESFTVKDLFKNVEILTSHEFKNGFATINIINNVPNNIYITGDFNSLLQVVNNIVVNAIQSYEKKGNNKVDLIGNISDETGDIIISIRDFGKGMSKDVQNKLFKQMVTTKGKYGTGLGLYMAYSTIKGKFGGDIKFDSEEGKGTVFHVVLSSYKKKENDLDSPGIISDLRPITGDTSDTIVSREDIYSKNDNIEDIKEEKKVEKENKIKEEKSEKKTTKKK